MNEQDKKWKYCHNLENIKIAYDTTDHFSFICPVCDNDCIIWKTKTIKNMVIDFEDNKDNCTWFYVYCPQCNEGGQRKIYWNSHKHKGRSKRGRTDWKSEFLKAKFEKDTAK